MSIFRRAPNQPAIQNRSTYVKWKENPCDAGATIWRTTRVASATWTIFDAYGNPVGKSPLTYPLSTEAPIQPGGVPPGDLSPVASFQVIFGGRWNAAYAKFSSGAGVIIYEADQAMTVDWWPACVGYQGGTIENSNIGYSVLEATPSTLFSQAFGVLPDTAQMRVANPNGRKLPTSPGY